MRIPTPTKADTDLLEAFDGLSLEHILVPASLAEFAAASAEIRAAGVVGFDTEAKPTFAKGEASEGPHIVQFATQDKAYIFQLHRPEGRPFLIEILESEDILKVGFGLKSDHGQIRNKLGVLPAAVLDLNELFRKEGYGGSTGVRAGVAIALNRKFIKSKKITTSNWSSPRLSPKQLLYAANDAYAALRVLLALDRPRSSLPVTGGSPAPEATNGET